MKHWLRILVIVPILLIGYTSSTYACFLGFGNDCNNTAQVPYCTDPATCTLAQGASTAGNGINDIEKNQTFTQYSQSVIAYLLGFVAIIAVIYIIWAGAGILMAGANEEPVKKGKQTLMNVAIGMVLIFLAYSIVVFVINVLNKSAGTTGFITSTAYADSTLNTFTDYANKIQLLEPQMDREARVNGSLSAGTLNTLTSLITASTNTFPDDANAAYNASLANAVLTDIQLVQKNSSSSAPVISLAKDLTDYLNKIKIPAISGTLSATPQTGNAPLTVSLSANNVIDPSGVTIPTQNFVWWLKNADGSQNIIGTGPSLVYTFSSEKNYTVYLTVYSANTNSRGYADVIPLQTSTNISVLPKIGTINLYLNGNNISLASRTKISPSMGQAGVIIDATTSQVDGGKQIVQTAWDFGNGITEVYQSAPKLERVIFANIGSYKVSLTLTLNNGQLIQKSWYVDVLDPIATVLTDKTHGYVNDQFHFTASTYYAQANLNFGWQIIDTQDNSVLATGNAQTVEYKFPHVGKFIVKLTTRVPSGQTDEDSQVITIESRDPVANLEVKPYSSDSPNTFTVDATKSYDQDSGEITGLSFSWLLDGQPAQLTDPTRNGGYGQLTIPSVGNHKITLEVTNPSEKTVTAQQTVVVTSILSAHLLVTPRVAHVGQSASFVVDAPEATVFEWNF